MGTTDEETVDVKGGAIEIREAVTDDLQAIVELLADDPLGKRREAPGPPRHAAYDEAFAALSADPNHLLTVATRDNVVIGCMQVSFIPGLSHCGAWRGQIESVRIAASARGLGLGRTLVRWAIEQCRARGCRLVQLTTDRTRADARRFYETLGFTASHDGMKLGL